MKDDRLKEWEVSWWIEKDGYGYGDSFDDYEKAFLLYEKMNKRNVFMVKLQKTVHITSNNNDYYEEISK